MTNKVSNPLNGFNWQPQPLAAALVSESVQNISAASSEIALLAQRMRDETGTRLIDWLETIAIEESPAMLEKISAAGFVKGEGNFWRNPRGLFPKLLLHSEGAAVEIKVDSVEDFSKAWRRHFKILIHGDPAGGQFRAGTLVPENSKYGYPSFAVIQRHGSPSEPSDGNTNRDITAVPKHRAAFAKRQRSTEAAAQGFGLAQSLFKAAAADLDPLWASSLFFAAERDYWMSRNHAARVQYERQQKLGLGWGNHDHHTYRSSRECFHLLVGVLEQMGFECRERFYAGREAGWGAQVLEHSACGIIVFADVDLSPEEIADDFAHQPLAPSKELGTVGLWCALHGESFLEAGMHHLECQFDFDAARVQLAAAGVETMAPFTDFSHLKQAFTQGKTWPVATNRINELLAKGHIDVAQAEQFRGSGALGSHLEILERNDGYKGFNQTGISDIIARTDPRKW